MMLQSERHVAYLLAFSSETYWMFLKTTELLTFVLGTIRMGLVF